MTIAVTMLAPAVPPSTRGNAVTVARLAAGVRPLGYDVTTLALEGSTHPPADATRIIHFFHLIQSYTTACAWGGRATLSLPYVLSQTGTDLSPGAAPDTDDFRAFVAGARVVTTASPENAAALRTLVPRLSAHQLVVIPKSLDLPTAPSHLDPGLVAALHGRVVVLMPGHLRPVKGQDFALAAWRHASPRLPAEALLVIAGAVLDPAFAAALDCHGASILRLEVPRNAMPALYAASTLVLNASQIESVPNSLLEALYLGTPVLAPDLPGIRAIAERSQSAATASPSWPLMTFDRDAGPAALGDALAALLADRAALATRGQAARIEFAGLTDTAREAAAYARVYKTALA